MLYRGVMERTPVGNVIIHADAESILRVDFEKKDNSDIVKYFTKHFGEYKVSPGFCPEMGKAMVQLSEYFEGSRKQFDLSVKLMGTDFYLKCWKALCQIPYGKTISYKELANIVGSPKGFRAVGQANHNNPLIVVIPCHRVLASDGTLGGYGGGLDNKELLLKLEKENS